MSRAPALCLESSHARALADAVARIRQEQAPPDPLHRSVRRLRPGRATLAVALVLAAGATLAVWRARPMVEAAWERLVLWWAQALRIPLAVEDDGALRRWVYLADAQSLLPGPTTGVISTVVVIVAFASTWRMPDRFMPLKYLVRILCVVQGSALLFFMAMPGRFPYTVGAHLSAVLTAGYGLVLVLPALLALGYGVLELPVRRKLADPLLLLAYFALAVPHKAVLHVLVLQHLSVLFMPLLYLCFGLLFDVMLFVALYSWLVSRAAADDAA